MRSITLNLILGFFAIGLVSIFIIILLARQNTRDEFTRFVVEGRGEDLITQLAEYYETNGSWDGAEQAFAPEAQPEGQPPYPSFTIADANLEACLREALGQPNGALTVAGSRLVCPTCA